MTCYHEQQYINIGLDTDIILYLIESKGDYFLTLSPPRAAQQHTNVNYNSKNLAMTGILIAGALLIYRLNFFSPVNIVTSVISNVVSSAVKSGFERLTRKSPTPPSDHDDNSDVILSENIFNIPIYDIPDFHLNQQRYQYRHSYSPRRGRRTENLTRTHHQNIRYIRTTVLTSAPPIKKICTSHPFPLLVSEDIVDNVDNIGTVITIENDSDSDDSSIVSCSKKTLSNSAEFLTKLESEAISMRYASSSSITSALSNITLSSETQTETVTIPPSIREGDESDSNSWDSNSWVSLGEDIDSLEDLEMYERDANSSVSRGFFF